MSAPYIDRKTVNKSYRPLSNVMSPGLKRAREPFRVRNALTGLLLASFAVGVWAYSLNAVKQDDFSDVDEEAKALAGSSALAAETADSIAREVVNAAETALEAHQVSPKSSERGPSERPRGVLAAFLAERYPKALDPKTNTLIPGAPPVDNFGRLRDWWRQSRNSG